MFKNRWYTKTVSKFVDLKQEKNKPTGALMENVQKEVNENVQKEVNNDFNLDVNIIISTFQEKLNSLMTELVIKEATIKQQASIIKRLRGE